MAKSSISGIVQMSPFDVLTTFQPTYYTSSGNNITYTESLPGIPGGVAFTADGRRFRLATLAVSGTTLAPSKLVQGPANTAAFLDGTVSAASTGDTTITFTASGSTTVANGALAGGFLQIKSGTGSVQTLGIAANTAVTSGTAITLTLSDPLVIATTGIVGASVYLSPFTSTVVMPTTLTGSPIGVPMVSVTASTVVPTFYWAQDQGFATVLAQGSITIGTAVSPSGTTAGALMALSSSPQVGIAVEAGANGAYSAFKLQID